MTTDRSKSTYDVVDQAIAFGAEVGGDLTEAVDTSTDHIATLLEDAYQCYDRASFGTCVFLAITALEETAKAELLVFSRPATTKIKGRDPLLSHAKKHEISVRETTLMGRLPGLLGREACERLWEEAHDGTLNKLREQALYVHADKDGVRAPIEFVDRGRAREILLTALESADDILVGSTNTWAHGRRWDAIIEALGKQPVF